jgi:SOS-response transcriptional repressor LexA
MLSEKDIGARIKRRRENVGYTVLKVLDKLQKNGIKISRATYHRYEGGKVEEIPLSFVSGMAEILNVDPGYLLGWHDEPFKQRIQKKEIKSETGIVIDVYKTLSIENQEKNTGKVTGEVMIPKEWLLKVSMYYAIEVTDNDMYPEYKINDVVIAKEQNDFDKEGDYLVHINNKEAVIRKLTFNKEENKITLTPLNMNIPAEEYDLSKIRIIGKVVEIRRKKE